MKPLHTAWCAVGFVLSLCVALSGCGMSTLERHTTAAGLLHGATGVAASVIDQGAREAAAGAGDADELRAALVPWRRAEAAQHLVAAAVEVYIAEVLAMAVAEATGEADDERARRALVHAVTAYRALVDLLAEYGVTLPSVASVLRFVAEIGGALQP